MPVASESQHRSRAGDLMHFPSKCKLGPALGIPRESRCCTQARSQAQVLMMAGTTLFHTHLEPPSSSNSFLNDSGGSEILLGRGTGLSTGTTLAACPFLSFPPLWQVPGAKALVEGRGSWVGLGLGPPSKGRWEVRGRHIICGLLSPPPALQRTSCQCFPYFSPDHPMR